MSQAQWFIPAPMWAAQPQWTPAPPASVVGVPNEIAGEHIWAFVLPKMGVTLTPTGVLSFMRGEVAPYKIPDQVRIVDQLPLTPTGKVQKFVLREWALKELNAPQSLSQ